MSHNFPAGPDGITKEFLSGLISEMHPGTLVENVTIGDTLGFEKGRVSTSARVFLDLEYAKNPSGLPAKAVAKLSKPEFKLSGRMYGLYANEVRFYRDFRPRLTIETPKALGAQFDLETNRYVLLLADLGQEGAHFPSQLESASLEQVRAILDTYAQLHAEYWQSAELDTDLSWIDTYLSGPLHDVMENEVREGIGLELAHHKFKRELLEQMRTTESELFASVAAVQRHQATLPQTVLHGDAHFGNTYRTESGQAGLYDWQLFARGFCLHDTAYAIITTLSIEQRREHERELLAYYRDRLEFHGVIDPPPTEALWLEYRRAACWSFLIGWLSAPTAGYGWEHLVVALQRTATAFVDLEAAHAARDLP